MTHGHSLALTDARIENHPRTGAKKVLGGTWASRPDPVDDDGGDATGVADIDAGIDMRAAASRE